MRWTEVSRAPGAAVVVLAALMLGGIAQAGEDFEVASQILEKHQSSLVVVRFTANQKMFGQEQDVETFVQGVVVAPDLVVINSGPFEEAKMPEVKGLGGMMGGGNLFGSREKPKDIKIWIEKDNEIPAKFVGMEKPYTLAFLRAEKELPSQCKPVSLQSVSLKTGSRIWVLSRKLLKKLDHPFEVLREHVSAVWPKPALEYQIQQDASADCSLAFDSEGTLIGLINSSRALKSAFETEGEIDIGSIGAMMSGIFSGGGLGSVGHALIPAEVLNPILANPPIERPRSWLGFMDDSLEVLSKDVASALGLEKNQKGIRLANVPEETPLAKAALKPGDIVLEIAEHDFRKVEEKEMSAVLEKLKDLPIGKEVPLVYLRSDKGKFRKDETAVVPVVHPVRYEEADPTEVKVVGVKVRPLTYDFRHRNNLGRDVDGAAIFYVKPGSPADIAGLDEEDVLLGIGTSRENMIQLKSPEDLEKTVKSLAKDKPKELIAKAWRDQDTQFFTLRIVKWPGAGGAPKSK